MYSGYLKRVSCNLWQHKWNQSSLGWNYKDRGDGRDMRAWITQLAAFISAYTACTSACTLCSHPSSESGWICFSPISKEGILKTLLRFTCFYFMYMSVWPACVCVPCVCSAPGVPKRAPDPHELELWIEDILIAQRWQSLYANIFRNLYWLLLRKISYLDDI